MLCGGTLERRWCVSLVSLTALGDGLPQMLLQVAELRRGRGPAQCRRTGRERARAQDEECDAGFRRHGEGEDHAGGGAAESGEEPGDRRISLHQRMQVNVYRNGLHVR